MGIADTVHCLRQGLGRIVSISNSHISSMNLSEPPKRLVSLVPSITASLYDLDLADRVVGVTDYCPQPPGIDTAIPTVGGPRAPSLEEILALKPDLILANQEENDRESVEQLERAGLTAWVTFPCSIDQSIEMLWTLLRIIPSESQATSKLLVLERSLDWARRTANDQLAIPVFYPIWMDFHEDVPWFMTIHSTTYAHDVLEVCGARNIFAERERRYPLEADLGLKDCEEPGARDCRYPRVTLAEVSERSPELILLPDEPFAFSEDHVGQIQELLHDTPAAKTDNIHIIDGKLVHWHGTTLAKTLAELPLVIQRASYT